MLQCRTTLELPTCSTVPTPCRQRAAQHQQPSTCDRPHQTGRRRFARLAPGGRHGCARCPAGGGRHAPACGSRPCKHTRQGGGWRHGCVAACYHHCGLALPDAVTSRHRLAGTHPKAVVPTSSSVMLPSVRHTSTSAPLSAAAASLSHRWLAEPAIRGPLLSSTSCKGLSEGQGRVSRGRQAGVRSQTGGGSSVRGRAARQVMSWLPTHMQAQPPCPSSPA